AARGNAFGPEASVPGDAESSRDERAPRACADPKNQQARSMPHADGEPPGEIRCGHVDRTRRTPGRSARPQPEHLPAEQALIEPEGRVQARAPRVLVETGRLEVRAGAQLEPRGD